MTKQVNNPQVFTYGKHVPAPSRMDNDLKFHRQRGRQKMSKHHGVCPSIKVPLYIDGCTQNII